MNLFILLFLGGIGYVELVIVLAVAFIPGFFICRALLRAVLKRGPESVNKFSIIGGLMLAPALVVAVGLVFGILYWTVFYQSPSRPELNKLDTTDMDYAEPSPETAHPAAKALLTEDFYWSPIEEGGPFGNDDGADAFTGFVAWRDEHSDESPVVYFDQLIDDWGFPRFDMSKTTATEIKTLLADPNSFVINQDNAVIAVGFGQFVLEGKMDSDIKELTRQAIERELNEIMISQYRTDYRERRRSILQKMLVVVERIEP